LHLLLWAAGNTDCSVHVARLDMSRYIVIRCDIGARVLPLRDDFNPRHSVSVAGGFSCRDAGLAPIGSEQSRGYLAASQSCSICDAPPHRALRLVGFRRCPPSWSRARHNFRSSASHLAKRTTRCGRPSQHRRASSRCCVARSLLGGRHIL